MGKIAIVYWSGTGNTQAMAEMAADGAKAAGAKTALFTAAQFTPEHVASYDAIGFGCPSMGAEVLEESEFQPMWDAVLPKLTGKQIALFGSYGWGDGEWMRDWTEDCNDAGAQIVCEPVICCEAPDEAAQTACTELGKALAG